MANVPSFAVSSTTMRAINRRRQSLRLNLDRFEALVADPHDFGSVAAGDDAPEPLTLPGNARLALSCSAALDAGDVAVSIGARRAFSHPDLAAGEVHRGEWGERGQEVVVARGAGAPAGTLTLYLVDDMGRHRAIGAATFS